MSSESSPWQIKSSKTVYENRWMRIREDSVVTPTGTDGIYAVLESNDSVKIIAVDDEQRILLIHKFRYTDQSWAWELPGGGSDKQEIIEAAQRELREETGVSADSWRQLGRFNANGGFMTEFITTLLACDIHITDSFEKSDEVVAERRFFSLEKIYAMIDDGRINSGASIASLMLYHRWLAKSGSGS